MTPRQITLARALGECSFPPATSQKRVAKNLAFLAEHSPERPISPRQAAYLCILIYRYRRQIPTKILCMAQDEAEELEQLAPGNIGCPPIITPHQKHVIAEERVGPAQLALPLQHSQSHA